MTTHRSSWLLALTLVACTSLEARDATGPSKPTPETPTDPTGTPKDPDTDKAPAVAIVVASVTLEQDCPDPVPASPAVVAPSEVAPAPKRAPSAGVRMPPRPGEAPSVVAQRRACQQSTLQLEIRNDGKTESGIRIASIELRDVQSNSVLVPVRSRLPSAWADGASYDQWNERIAANTKLNVSYRLTPPEWHTVEGKLGGGVDSHGRQFELDITVEIDGKPVTVRSPAFTRAPQIIMPPT